ncbi:fiber [Human mastadenovirus D]|uniref:Fiber n=1 Tax=Human mastadenovirus D TaxID=130310 RepID=T1UM09_9ADEN|nr:fiber [Human mastadenovirus D]
MSKRLRVEDDFNPVYPYGYARNQNIPFLTPPFVSSDGFQNFPPGVLSLKLADPIAIVNGNVSLKVGGGLTLQEGTGDLKVNAKSPLQVATNKQLEIALAKPFEEKDGKLALKIGHGLAVVDENHTHLQSLIGTLVILTGKGIGTGSAESGGTIDVRLGSGGGLSFDKDGNLVAWNKDNDRRTLWTTPDPSPNCNIDQEKDSKLTLVLTKCGSQILANMSLLVVKGKFCIINNKVNATDDYKKFSIKLLFDAKGRLLEGSSLDKAYWNYRSVNNNIGTAYEEAVGFMPNTTAYPKLPNPPTSSTTPIEKSRSKNKYVSNLYLGGQAGNPVATTISFNEEIDDTCAYSIRFDFAWNKTYENVQFDSSFLTFSYIAQE